MLPRNHPALMPAVGTPELGGMSWHDLIGLVM